MTDPMQKGPLLGEAALGALVILDHLTEVFTISAALSKEPTISFEGALMILEVTKRDPTIFPPEVVRAFDASAEAD